MRLRPLPAARPSTAVALVAALAGAGIAGPVAPASAKTKSPPKAVGRTLLTNNLGALVMGAQGSTPEQVRKLLGKPSKTTKIEGEIIYLEYGRKYGLSLSFDGLRRYDPAGPQRLTGVSALTSRYRTPEGLKVGSTEAAVKAAFPTATCGIVSGYTPDPDHTVCTTTSGENMTFFESRKGKVKKISITAGLVSAS